MTADLQLLINVATIFSELFTTSKAPLILKPCLNINFELLIIGCNQARYVSRDTCLECLPPLKEILCFLQVRVVWEALENQWNDMVSRKSYK